MTKYSNEFKLKVIKEYLDEGTGFAALDRKYNIASRKNIVEWVNQYQTTGSIGRTENASYSFEFQKLVVEYSLSHSNSDTSKRFSVFPSSAISSWRTKVAKFGYDGLKNKVRGTHLMTHQNKSIDVPYEVNQLAKTLEENRRLRMESAVLKKIKCLSGATKREKKEVVDILRRIPDFKLDELLTFVSLSRSTYYYLKSHPRNTISDDKLANLIKEIKAPRYQEEDGYRRVTGELHDNGYLVNHKHVLSIMRRYNLLSKKYNTRRRRYNSYRGSIGRIADRLIKRDFKADKPYQK